MKKYSSLFLFVVTTLFLLVVYALFLWRNDIYRFTFLNIVVVRWILLAALCLAVFVTLVFVSGRLVSGGRGLHWLKVYAASVFILFLLFAFLMVTATWILPGTISTYFTRYTYVQGDSRNCSGVRVFDIDLSQKIRICNPTGDIEDSGIILVTKRTNTLGTVIMSATTSP